MNFEKDFPMLKKNIIYFDNAATSFKPQIVIDAMNEYYEEYCANSHRGDYNISFKVDDEYDRSRETVRYLINARRKEEIIFTQNTTDSINMVVNGFFERILDYGDEILLTKSEHASNILPWFILSLKKKLVVKYIELDENNKLTIDALLKAITNKTKVISIAQVTNVIGDVRDIKKITEIAHNNNIFVVVDGAQSVPHMEVDVLNLDCDFLAFSAHKMCGPTGVGILYGKYELLKKMLPVRTGGGMNKNFSETELFMEDIPYRFEAGTQNLSGIIAFRKSIEYLKNIGIDNINRHEGYLKRYLIKRLSEIPYIKIYNENSESSIVLINAENILSGDLGLYLNSKNICVRSGAHCAKLLKTEHGIKDTVRISLYFYNTYEEIDYLIEVLKDEKSLYQFI
jgi:cysteine desulfurase/selenocysteine lyase